MQCQNGDRLKRTGIDVLVKGEWDHHEIGLIHLMLNHLNRALKMSEVPKLVL